MFGKSKKIKELEIRIANLEGEQGEWLSYTTDIYPTRLGYGEMIEAILGHLKLKPMKHHGRGPYISLKEID